MSTCTQDAKPPSRSLRKNLKILCGLEVLCRFSVPLLLKPRIPHFSTSTQEAYDESRRLFYVGLTRAKRILLVASDQSHWRNKPTTFIAEAGLG
ncbi:3'-5' exonuclease [Ensifer canadensis]|uniref:3'-5' exonuclease n=1 Tax=Ensifer canadensis TaxID=555315 RepID=UPI001CEC1F77|nr:3'-5' exonuclease [Ensifer canadensis]